MQSSGLLDRFPPVVGLPDELDVGLVAERHLERGPHQGLVVNSEHADRHRVSMSRGKLAVTR